MRRFLICILVVSAASSFSPEFCQRRKTRTTLQSAIHATASRDEESSRSSSSSSSSHHLEAVSRRQWFASSAAAATTAAGTGAIVVGLLLGSTPAALAATDEEVVQLDPVAVQAAFAAVREQVFAADGGVAYLGDRIGAADFPAVMEFAKTYDQVLRKGAMGQAKKMLLDKPTKEMATIYANAVTFDLIGMNRSSRPGQESQENAAKYLQELKDDVQKFLDLEPVF